MTAITLSTKKEPKLKEILTIGRYFREKYGTTVYKTPISITGFTCPNIDGTVAKGGCVYCENESFSPNLEASKKTTAKFKLNLHSEENPFLEQQIFQLEAQYKKTKIKLSKKFDAKKFIVYFQSFTNTYAPFSTIKALYEKAFSFPEVVGISIGTRSDSISDDVLEYLSAKVKEGKEVWIEYGVQSVYDETLKFINRGHDVQNAKELIIKTRKMGINVCAHIIFGLPNESPKMMLEGIKQICFWGANSIKIHPLYITKNTKLANYFKKELFVPICEDVFLQTLVEAIKIMPSSMIVQRISAGDSTLVAPKWCSDHHKQMKNAREALKNAGYLY